MEWWNGGRVEWWNGGMVEWRNGGMAEWWNGGMAENDAKSYNTERWKTTLNPITRNGGK